MLGSEYSIAETDSKRQVTDGSMKSLTFPYPTSFLHHNTVDSMAFLWQAIPFTSISASASISSGLELLRERRITCLPLYEQTQKGEHHVITTVNVRDIVAHFVDRSVWEEGSYVMTGTTESGAPELLTGAQESATWTEREKAQVKLKQMMDFFNNPMKNLVGKTSESLKLHAVTPSTTTLDLITLFRCGVHHALIVSDQSGLVERQPSSSREILAIRQPAVPTSQILGVISQGDVLRYMWRHKDRHEISKVLDQSVSHVSQFAQSFQKDVDPNQPSKLPGSRWTGEKMKFALHLPHDELTISAFKTMFMHRVSSIAVVHSQNGSLMGSISSTDILLISQQTISLLQTKLSEFLGFVNERRPKGSLCVTQDSTLRDAVQKMVEENVHRVWVVDNLQSLKPVGIVSTSDVLGVLAPMDSASAGAAQEE